MIRTLTTMALCVAAAAACLAEPPAAGDPAISVGPEVTIVADGPGKDCRGTPQIAFGQESCLCVWREGWEGRNGGARIRAARLAPDGKALDPQTIDVAPNKDKDAPQERPRVAFAKDTFLVVWQDMRNGADYDVLAARVSAAGKLLDAEPIKIAAAPGNQALPDLAADGDGFLVVWQGYQDNDRAFHGYAARVDRQGKMGEPAETGISPQPKVAWDGTSFLASSSDTGFWNASDVVRLAADGKPIGKKITAMQRTAMYSLSAVPGKGWLLVSHRSLPDAWGWGGPGGMRATFILSDGTLDPSMPKEEGYPKYESQPRWLDFSPPSRENWPHGGSASAWDGKHSVVVWQRYHCTGEKKSMLSNCDLMAIQTDAWKRLSDTPTPVAASESEELEPALASDGAGKLLCVYEKEIGRKTVLCARAVTSR